MSDSHRRLAVRLLTALAACAVTLGLVVGYVQVAAIDSDQFANRATEALRDENVQAVIAARITDQVVLRNDADLLAFRPIIESVTTSLVGGPAFTSLFRAGVNDVHRAVFEQDQNTVTLTINDIGSVLAGALQVLQPSLAEEFKGGEQLAVVTRDIGRLSAGAARLADAFSVVGSLLLLIAVVCGAAALAISPDRRRTTTEMGIGVAIGVGRRVAAAAGRHQRDAAAGGGPGSPPSRRVPRCGRSGA
jgi:hypothetical protein